ncbi:hypothetical protein O9X98_10130 [Agrobacterium salinitolerans]|nr:hypothetical protein [Agrobacterium salinitolerans]
MIDQVRSDVHIPGAAPLTSEASRAVWMALSCDALLGWYDGGIRYSSDLEPDRSVTGLTQAIFTEKGIPSIFLDMLISMDLEIPPAGTVLANLDPHVSTISFESPAFNLPERADIQDLAICIAASRIAWEIRDSLIRPSDVSTEEMENALRRVGLNALAIGGIGVYPYAKAILADPDLWKKIEVADTGMEFGSEEQ